MILAESPRRLSTTDAVSLVMRRNYVFYEALRLKVVNYHALAARLAPGVEELTGKKAKVPTLVVAVKRFSDSMTEERASELQGILGDARVTLTGGVTEVSVRVGDVPPSKVLSEVLKLSGACPELSAG